MQYIVACILVIFGMVVALGLVRLAANLVILIIGGAACLFVVYSIAEGIWIGWFEICWHALATGGAVALLSLPVLPFSSFYKKK